MPKLSREEKALVDAWWDAIDPYYNQKKTEPDKIIPRILAFSQEHPDLFPHLHLGDELIYEVGAELGRRQRFSEYE